MQQVLDIANAVHAAHTRFDQLDDVESVDLSAYEHDAIDAVHVDAAFRNGPVAEDLALDLALQDLVAFRRLLETPDTQEPPDFSPTTIPRSENSQ